MSFFFELKTITQAERENAVRMIVTESSPGSVFYLSIILSSLVGTFGLILSEPTIIIASVLISPILYPFLGIGLSFAVSDVLLMKHSIKAIIRAFIYSLFSSIIVVFLFGSLGNLQSSEIIIRSNPSILYLFVAIVTTAALSIFIVKNDKFVIGLANSAMALSIIPTISVIGIGLAQLNFQFVQGAILLFIVNVLGVIFSSMVLFSLFNLSEKRSLVVNTMSLIQKRNTKERKKIVREKNMGQEEQIVNTKKEISTPEKVSENIETTEEDQK